MRIKLGAFQLHAYASRQSLNQSFSSIASDRNSENLTRTQVVPAQQVGFSAQWQRSVGTRQHLVAGVEESDVHGQTNEQGYFGGDPTSTFAGGGREVNWGGLLRGHHSHHPGLAADGQRACGPLAELRCLRAAQIRRKAGPAPLLCPTAARPSSARAWRFCTSSRAMCLLPLPGIAPSALRP